MYGTEKICLKLGANQTVPYFRIPRFIVSFRRLVQRFPQDGSDQWYLPLNLLDCGALDGASWPPCGTSWRLHDAAGDAAPRPTRGTADPGRGAQRRLATAARRFGGVSKEAAGAAGGGRRVATSPPSASLLRRNTQYPFTPRTFCHVFVNVWYERGRSDGGYRRRKVQQRVLPVTASYQWLRNANAVCE